MSELNRLKVVDFTMGRSDSDEVNTNLPFTDNFEKTRTIQQANVVLGAYVNRNYNDMQNKADKDEIPTKVSELENDVGYITDGDIPSKTSDLTNDGADGEHPYITNQVDDLVNYTDTETLNTDLGLINDDISDINTNLQGLNDAIDLQLPNRIGDIVVDSIRSKNMFNKYNIMLNTALDGTTGTTVTNNARITSFYIEVKPSTSYIFSNANDLTTNGKALCFYNSSKTFISGTELSLLTNGVFTTPANTKYIRFGYVSTGNYNDLQLETGSIVTPYKPYQNLNGMETYSSNEIVIGTWVNGKPIYRRTYNINMNKENSYGIINPDNIDTITNLNILQKDNTGAYISAYYWNNTDYLRIFDTNGYIQVRTSKNNNTFIHYINIEYTKTTD